MMMEDDPLYKPRKENCIRLKAILSLSLPLNSCDDVEASSQYMCGCASILEPFDISYNP